jgi:hypothetical protein
MLLQKREHCHYQIEVTISSDILLNASAKPSPTSISSTTIPIASPRVKSVPPSLKQRDSLGLSNSGPSAIGPRPAAVLISKRAPIGFTPVRGPLPSRCNPSPLAVLTPRTIAILEAPFVRPRLLAWPLPQPLAPTTLNRARPPTLLEQFHPDLQNIGSNLYIVSATGGRQGNVVLCFCHERQKPPFGPRIFAVREFVKIFYGKRGVGSRYELNCMHFSKPGLYRPNSWFAQTPQGDTPMERQDGNQTLGPTRMNYPSRTDPANA